MARIDDVESDLERMQTELAEFQMDRNFLGRQALLELEGFASRVGEDQIAQLTALHSEFSSLDMSLQFLENLTIPLPGGDIPLSIPDIELDPEDVARLAEAALEAAQELRCLFDLPGCVTADIEPLRWRHRLDPNMVSVVRDQVIPRFENLGLQPSSNVRQLPEPMFGTRRHRGRAGKS